MYNDIVNVRTGCSGVAKVATCSTKNYCKFLMNLPMPKGKVENLIAEPQTRCLEMTKSCHLSVKRESRKYPLPKQPVVTQVVYCFGWAPEEHIT